MKKIKETLKDHTLMRYTIFIVFTFALITIFYFVIKNIGPITSDLLKGLESILSVLSPLFIGLVLAYLINPVVTFIEKKLMIKVIKLSDDPVKAKKQEKKKRLLSTFLSYLLVIAAIFAILYGFAALIVGNFVIKGLSNVIDTTIAYIQTYEATIRSWISSLPNDIFSDKIVKIASNVMEWWGNNFNASSIVDNITAFGGNLIKFVIGFIISIYLISDKDFFLDLWHKFIRLSMKEERLESANKTLSEINSVLNKFIKGITIDAIIVAILSSIGLYILGLDFAVFVGIFAGIANAIPYFGPIIGMIPAFIIGMFTEGFWQGAIAVIILFGVQQIDCNIIYPKVVGSSTGLHPLFVLLAVTIFGSYGGILGMVIAVPIAGIIQVFIKRIVNRVCIKKNLKIDDL